MIENQDVSFRQNLDDSIPILKSAAEWRTQHDIPYSPIWDPKLVSKKAYFEEFHDFQAYVLYVDNEPIATATLADPSEKKLDLWEDVLGKEYKSTSCLYLDDLAVVGDKIGQGIFGTLLDEIEEFARKGGYTSLRLDCDSQMEKLVEAYKKYGFKEVCKKDMGYRVTMFMDKPVEPAS